MKHMKKLFLFTILFLYLMLLPLHSAAAPSWTGDGYGRLENGVWTLTKNYMRGSAGAVVNSMPIDTRNGFTLSFDYWSGERKESPNMGLHAMFTNIVPSGFSWGTTDFGYSRYVWDTELDFHSVRFEVNSERIRTAKNVSRSLKYTAEADAALTEDEWHSVTLRYQNGTMQIWHDGILALTSTDFVLPGMSYVALSTTTRHTGMHTTQVRNISLTAAEPSLITYDANGGTLEAASEYVLSYSNHTMPTPTKYGHNFLGWFTSPAGGTKITPSAYGFAPQQTLYAQWQDYRVTVKFNANKGKVSETSRILLPDEKIGTLPTPTRKKYTFLGWYTKKSGGKKISDTYSVSKNKTVYAHWVKNSSKKTIKLMKNGGSCSKASIKVTYGGKLKGLPKATRKGYRFLGWYTAKSGGTKVTASTKTASVLSVKKLYAHWAKNASSSGSSGSSGSSWSGSSGSSSDRTCIVCGGSGRRSCLTCNGRGYVTNYSSGLYGSGSSTTIKSCPSVMCSGGKVRCSSCGGDGRR